MQHTLIRLARVSDACNVNARHIKARPRKDEVGKSRFVRANRGRSFAINPADVRGFTRADSNGKISFLKSAGYWEDRNDRQKNGRRKRQPKDHPRIQRDLSPRRVAVPSAKAEKHLHERRRTSYTSPVTETEVTRFDIRSNEGGQTADWRSFFVRCLARAFNGRALAGERSRSPVSFVAGMSTLSCARPPRLTSGESGFLPNEGVRNAC